MERGCKTCVGAGCGIRGLRGGNLSRAVSQIDSAPFCLKQVGDAFYSAVYHKLPVVVWGLRSNGWYLSGNHIEKGQQIISMWEPHDLVGSIIKEILENPPPLQNHHPWRCDDHLSIFKFSSNDDGFLEGTVLDFYREQHQCSIQLKRHSMAAIIYEDGPRKIMKPGRYLDLSSFKEVLLARESRESSSDIPTKQETSAD